MIPEEVAQKLILESQRCTNPIAYIAGCLSTMTKIGYDDRLLREAIVAEMTPDQQKELIKLINDTREL